MEKQLCKAQKMQVGCKFLVSKEGICDKIMLDVHFNT